MRTFNIFKNIVLQFIYIDTSEQIAAALCISKQIIQIKIRIYKFFKEHNNILCRGMEETKLLKEI